MTDLQIALKCPFSGSTNFKRVFVYKKKPEVEVSFECTAGQEYYREVWQCEDSKHYLSIHDMDISAMYGEDYVSSNYKDLEGIHRTFERIIALPASKSDNTGRVKRIDAFAQDYYGSAEKRTVLDVGSGLGVFPYAMKQTGWECTALDPDARTVAHLEEMLDIRCIQGDFFDVTSEQRFDVVTLNKVLEHVEDPVAMLKRSHNFLKDDGFVYIELPDGEMAAKEGSEREEFAIDHIHVFSLLSTVLMAEKAGFTVLCVERLQEPSSKFTIYAFLKKDGKSG